MLLELVIAATNTRDGVIGSITCRYRVRLHFVALKVENTALVIQLGSRVAAVQPTGRV